jgi:anti-anti-sigma factor
MFEVRVEPDGRVIVAGRLDAAESDRALSVFRGLSGPTTMDCSGLEYISSAGIAVIMDTYKRLSVGGHPLRLVQVAPKVKVILEYAGLTKLLGIS